jgi:TRAP-type C4-dicarboxylate transport system substrate-binding protein
VDISELYESLSRGVIDAIFMATSAVLPLKWYEIGEAHLKLCENQVVSQPLTVNLDVWNSLPEDIQKIFEEASLETSQWSIEADMTNTQNTYDAFEKAGVPIKELSEEDNMTFWEVYLKHGTENYLDNAENMGVLEQAQVIQRYWDEMKWGDWKK